MAIKDLKERAIRGGFAKLGSQAANFVLRIGSLMILARQLDPKDFGLVAMVTAVSGLFSLFKEAGLSAATIQRATINDEQMSTLFWINMLVGVTLAVLLIGTAPVLVAFYHEPRLYWVAVALSADFLFTGASVQHSALLQRQMRFVADALINVISLVASITVAIAMAIGGWGYWALVGQAAAYPGASAICLWITVRWTPGMPRRKVGIRSMLRFGGTVTLNGLVVYVAYNLEKALLGRFWGAEILGLYGRAYQLVNIPTSNLNDAVGGIAFSTLSRLQDDHDRLKSYFLKGYNLVLSITLPITITCVLFANDLILVLLGAKWLDAVPIFRLLAPTILVFAMINPMWWLLVSTGKVERSLKIALVLAPLVIAGYLIGLPYGPTGVALAYSTVMTLWLVPHIAWCIHGTMVAPFDLVRAVGRPFISGLVAGAVCFGLKLLGGQLLSPFVRLLFGGSMLLCLYLWMLLYVMRQKAFYLNVLQSLKRSRQGE